MHKLVYYIVRPVVVIILILGLLISHMLVYTNSALAVTNKSTPQLIREGIYYYSPEGYSCPTSGNVGAAPETATLKEFVDAYVESAFDIGKQYGIPYETILAQAILESGYGKSTLTKEAFNFFGIKAGSSWSGEIWTGVTYEEVNGVMVKTTADFRKYPNAVEGFRGYGEFITSNSRYSEALKYPGDPYRYLEEIKKAGYATDSEYVSKVSSIIKAVEDYIASTGSHPPSSQVTFDISPPSTQSGSSYDCNAFGTIDGSNDKVVEIANREYEKNGGVKEYGGTILEYTSGRKEAWCADFVSWVYKEAGLPFSGGYPKDWEYPSVSVMKSYFEREHLYFKVGEQSPQPGDIAFYLGGSTPDGGSTNHVNIVVEVNGNEMVTVGGNESDTIRKTTRTIELGNSALAGFGRYVK
jgi:hypothetical protein